jgi:hypothetical protein
VNIDSVFSPEDIKEYFSNLVSLKILCLNFFVAEENKEYSTGIEL